MGKFTVELDCPPGSPRPGDLLPIVLEGTGIKLDPEQTVSRFFGNWQWVIPPEQESLYSAVRPEVAERIRALYNSGRIRYGSW
jgi:hypothetical protein